MRSTKFWFKAYTEDWLANGIGVHLSLAQQAVFSKLQAAARTSPIPGTIQTAPGMPYTPKQLAYRLHIKTCILNSTLAALEQIKKITQDSEGIHITHWQEDQEPPPEEGKAEGKTGKGRGTGTPKEIDPDKYIKGKYGKLVQR